eukprot:gene8362-17227_t
MGKNFPNIKADVDDESSGYGKGLLSQIERHINHNSRLLCAFICLLGCFFCILPIYTIKQPSNTLRDSQSVDVIQFQYVTISSIAIGIKMILDLLIDCIFLAPESRKGFIARLSLILTIIVPSALMISLGTTNLYSVSTVFSLRILIRTLSGLIFIGEYFKHIWRTPCIVIAFLCYTIAIILTNYSMYTSSSSVTKAYIKVSGDLALQTINDFLLYDKTDSGSLALELEQTYIYNLMKDSIRPFFIQALQAGIAIVFENTNLENISDITPATSEQLNKLPKDLNVHYNNKSLSIFRISVRDNGPGITKVFSQRIATLHGGSLSVYSDGEGQGSTFFFDIPVFESTISKEDVNENEDEDDSFKSTFVERPRTLSLVSNSGAINVSNSIIGGGGGGAQGECFSSVSSRNFQDHQNIPEHHQNMQNQIQTQSHQQFLQQIQY